MTQKQKEDERPISPLVAQIIEANLAQSHETTNMVIEGLQKDLEYEKARSDAIVSGVLKLISGTYMPTTGALHNALYPTDDLIELFRPKEVS